MKQQQVPLAREGYPFILFVAFTTLLCGLFSMNIPALIGLVLTGFVTWFFRDPSRVTPADEDAVISPADGRVILIQEIDDDRFLKKRSIKISIFMNIFNVHVNRIPCTGTVDRVQFKAGKFYSADKNKAALQNEYCAVHLTTPSGIRYCVVQVAGLIARRIICRAEQGEIISTGTRYGLIRFGSRLDIYLPPEIKVDVQLRQKVKAGETILARLDDSQ